MGWCGLPHVEHASSATVTTPALREHLLRPFARPALRAWVKSTHARKRMWRKRMGRPHLRARISTGTKRNNRCAVKGAGNPSNAALPQVIERLRSYPRTSTSKSSMRLSDVTEFPIAFTGLLLLFPLCLCSLVRLPLAIAVKSVDADRIAKGSSNPIMRSRRTWAFRDEPRSGSAQFLADGRWRS